MPLALASALTKRALPSLDYINLNSNQLGGAGLTALAPALRQLPKLTSLSLGKNQIGDQGVASLLAPPIAGVLPSLDYLYLIHNQIAPRAGAAAAAECP